MASGRGHFFGFAVDWVGRGYLAGCRPELSFENQVSAVGTMSLSGHFASLKKHAPSNHAF